MRPQGESSSSTEGQEIARPTLANEKARRKRDDELRILALAVKLAAEALQRRLGES